MSFRSRSWEQRFNEMGDQAETIFEQVATDILKLGYVRYGLDRPPIQMHRLPARVRYTPDFLMSGKLVEVQGFGREQVLRLKVDKHGCLRWWNDLHPVELFLWDSHQRRWCFITLNQFDALLCDETAALGHFAEGKPYFAVPADAAFEASECVGEI